METFTGFLGGGYSPVTRAKNGSYVTDLGFGDLNTGREFFYDDFAVTSGKSITGIKFWWAEDVGTLTVRCRIYNWNNMTPIQSKDVTVSIVGVYTAVFDTPVAMTTAGAYKSLSVMTWETTGTRYTRVISFGTGLAENGILSGDNHIDVSPGLKLKSYMSGIGENGAIGASGESCPIEPTFDILQECLTLIIQEYEKRIQT